MKYTAFISHSTKDAPKVEEIRSFLESNGISCFVSSRDLKHNSQWQQQLVESMDESQMLIYVHSSNSNSSDEVCREINYFADRCRRPILVYRLDDTTYAPDRAYYLQSINYIDSLSSARAGLDMLLDNVSDTLSGKVATGHSDSGRKRKGWLWPVSALAAVIVVVAILAAGQAGRMHKQKVAREYAAATRTVDSLKNAVGRHLSREESLMTVFSDIDRAESIVTGFRDTYGKEYTFDLNADSLRSDAVAQLTVIRDGCITGASSLEHMMVTMGPSFRQDSLRSIVADSRRKAQSIDSLLNTLTK